MRYELMRMNMTHKSCKRKKERKKRHNDLILKKFQLLFRVFRFFGSYLSTNNHICMFHMYLLVWFIFRNVIAVAFFCSFLILLFIHWDAQRRRRMSKKLGIIFIISRKKCKPRENRILNECITITCVCNIQHVRYIFFSFHFFVVAIFDECL